MIRSVKSPVACVGIVCFRGEDVLLVRRGQPPRIGEWSIPGGRVEPGESENEAVLRELIEETSITAVLGPKIAAIPAHFDGVDYVFHDYVAHWIAGEPVADDDVTDAVFVNPGKLKTIEMWAKTREIIETARTLRSKNKIHSN